MKDVPVRSKIALTGGSTFWHSTAVPEAGLPAVMLTDGPHGVRKQSGSADHLGLGGIVAGDVLPAGRRGSRPPGIVELVRRVGEALGQEAKALGSRGAARARGEHQALAAVRPQLRVLLRGPVRLRRARRGLRPRRPVARAWARRSSTSPRTTRRPTACASTSMVDERTLREIYLRGFQRVVTQAQPWTVMCSYNRVNGVLRLRAPLAADRRPARGVGLRRARGLGLGRGLATASRRSQAGLDLEMPRTTGHEQAAVAAVEAGELDADTIDAACARLEKVLASCRCHPR